MEKKVLIDLAHPFGADVPRWPHFGKPLINNAHTIAKGGALTSKITCTMHTGAHCDAPCHVMEYEFDGRRAKHTHEVPVDAYTDDTTCLPINIGPWGLITGEHLDDACEKVGMKLEEPKDMVVCLNTGVHRPLDDSKAYRHCSIGTGVRAGKWFIKYGVKCAAMDNQTLDHPLYTTIGNNGMTCMNLLGTSGKSLLEEYKELFDEEAYAGFDKNEYINIHGQKTYDEKFDELEALGCWGIWELCCKELLGHSIAGAENLGGDPDKIDERCFRFYCLPLHWYTGDDSMARCTTEADKGDLAGASGRTYKYGDTGYQDSEGNGNSGLAYIQYLFDRNK